MDLAKQSIARVFWYCANKLLLFFSDTKILKGILIGQYFLIYLLGQNKNTSNLN